MGEGRNLNAVGIKEKSGQGQRLFLFLEFCRLSDVFLTHSDKSETVHSGKESSVLRYYIFVSILNKLYK